MRKRVSHEQIAEFVVNARNGNGKAWEKCDTDGDHCKKKQKSRKESSERKWRDDFRSQARDSLARLRENELQCKKRTRGDQGVIKSSDQRLQVRRIGNSVGLILPKELLARLKLKEGDKLHVIEEPERAFKLSPYDAKHAKARRTE